MSDNSKLEALRIIYDGQIGTIQKLFDRSFSTTLQALTLNVLIFVASFKWNNEFLDSMRIPSAFFIVLFNSLVIWYLIAKAKSHHKHRNKLAEIEKRLVEYAELDISFSYDKSFWESFFRGSFLFVASVALSAIAATTITLHPLLDLP